MKTSTLGQQSPHHSYVSIFAPYDLPEILQLRHLHGNIWRLIAFSFLFLAPWHSLDAALTSTPRSTAKASYSWSVNISLSCTLSSNSDIQVESHFPGQPGFAGFSQDFHLSANGQMLTYTLSGPAPTMPGLADVASITVTVDGCCENSGWLVSTDGGGTMLLIDEF